MGERKNPYLLLGLAMMIMALGSVLLLVHLGASARKAGELRLTMNSRKAPPPQKAGYADDFRRGTKVAAAAAADTLDNLFSGWGGGGVSASASGYRAGPGDTGGNGGGAGPGYFRKYYEKHFGGEDSSSASWEAYSGGSDYAGGGGAFSGGGGTFAGSGSTATSQDLPARPQPGGARQPEQGAAASPGGAPAAGTAGDQAQAAPRGGSQSSVQGSRPNQTSALTPKGPPPPLFPEGSQGGASAKSAAQRGGGLEGFQNKGGAPNLDGALEGAKTGSARDFGSKASGGASATAAAGSAAGGSGAPSASPVSAASKDGPSGGGSPGSSSGGPGAGAQTASAGSGYGWWSRLNDDSPGDPAAQAGQEDQDLVRTVVSERRNGTESQYLKPEDHEASPEESQLKAGAVSAPPLESEKAAQAAPPDPAEYSRLSPERRAELHRELHSFLKRVENRYGKMTDIVYTPCRQAEEVCEKHELTRGYLTMTTSEGAKVAVGLKHVKERWRRYTVEFKRPQQAPRPQPEEEAEEEEETEE